MKKALMLPVELLPATEIILALGGKENIKNLDACITRLRISVEDIKKVDKERIKALGASQVLELGNNIQAIFGLKSDQLKSQIKDVMNGKIPTKAIEVEKINKEVKENDYFVAPLNGKLLPLKDVPDQIFSQRMMGDGFAIAPTNGEVVSPVNGKIVTLFPTKHAVGIVAENGCEILIHFGIDTVKLKGEGFEALVSQDDIVKAGQPILRVNIDQVKKQVPSIITPVIFTNLSEEEKIFFKAGSIVKVGQKNILNIQ
jgi:PTS system D-glucosamine-specific IIC component